jgi:glycosyltransferase involved in cell wall biosynthesis
MTKVVYDHQVFEMQKFGGVSRYFCEIALRIDQRNHWRVQVVAPVHFNRHLAHSNLSTFGLYIPNPHHRLNRFYHWVNDLAVPPAMALSKPDLIHQTYYPEKQHSGSVPVVVTVYDMIHELFPQYFDSNDPTRNRKRASVLAADHVICISHNTAKDLSEIVGIPSAKITVTHLGFSAAFDQLPERENSPEKLLARPYLLYVGGRGGYKNFGRFLEAYAASAALARDLDVVAFGGGGFTRKELIRNAGLHLRPDAIRLVTGDDEALARFYSGARAFVYPSEYEGFGISPLEAMSCGCPVICSGGGSIPEVVGTAGEYFDASSVEFFKTAIEHVAFNDARRSELIAAGYIQCRRFSWDRCADETLSAYERALQRC